MVSRENEIKTLPRSFKLLSCKLTNDELLQAGQELAAVNQDIEAEEKDQVDIKAQMKARLTELSAKRTGISLKICRRAEERSIEVETMYDYTAGKYRETRLDTGEVIFERALYENELQAKLEV